MKLDEFHARFELGRDGRARAKAGGKLPASVFPAPAPAGSGSGGVALSHVAKEAVLPEGVNAARTGAKHGPRKDGNARSKFRNVPTVTETPLGPRRCASKREARHAEGLMRQTEAGEIVSFMPQVSIPVGKMGNRDVRAVIDALVILEVRPDGTFVGRFEDPTGKATAKKVAKFRAVEELYGVKVRLR